MFAYTALRLAVIEALAPAALLETGPFPTIAGRRVFDSRQDLIDAMDDEGPRPAIAVYTEEGRNSAYGSGRVHSDDGQVNIVVECAIIARGTVEFELANGETATVEANGAAITDRKHEALLDALCGQVRRVLAPKNRYSTAALLRRVAKTIGDDTSEPLRDADKVTRLAQRTMTFRAHIEVDDWTPGEGDFAALPLPLRMVAEALPAGSSGRALCSDLLPLNAPDVAPPPLESVHAFLGVGRMPASEADADIHAAFVPA